MVGEVDSCKIELDISVVDRYTFHNHIEQHV